MRSFSFLVILLLIVSSCEKDKIGDADYRVSYTGEFNFVVTSSTTGPGGNDLDTNYYSGSIRKYQVSDSSLHFYLDDLSIDPSKKIVVEISQSLKLSTVLNEDGSFVEKSDSIFNQSGAYVGYNSVDIIRYVNPTATFDETTHMITGTRL